MQFLQTGLYKIIPDVIFRCARSIKIGEGSFIMEKICWNFSRNDNICKIGAGRGGTRPPPILHMLSNFEKFHDVEK